MPSPRDKRAYLDYNATAPLRPEARAALVAALEEFGNPSSIHAEGRAARAIVEEARRDVAELVGVSARRVVFTSGGTEAANSLLTPHWTAPGRATPWPRLIVAAGEHPCVLRGHRFPVEAVEIARLDTRGRIDLGALEAMLAGPPAMLALQGANNETGVVQPVAEAAALVHARGGFVVGDMVQVAGRAALNAAWGADVIFVSAHKIGGPKGVGAWIAVAEGLHLVEPLPRGGGQERGARAGTENVPGIAGFGAAARAARIALMSEAQRLTAMRENLEARLLAIAPDAVIFGAGALRLPNTLCFAIPGHSASHLLMRLDLDGVAASSGSACSSGKVARSHVLTAMGVAPELAEGAVRLSLGWASRAEDIEHFARALTKIIGGAKRG